MKSLSSKTNIITCLFDIDREKYDGRTIGDYLLWLEKTTALFPNLIIYTDVFEVQNLDGLNGAKVRFMSQGDLWTFSYLERVSSLLKEYKPEAKGDITFTNPRYSLVQLSKFELCNLTAHSEQGDNVLWVDAGISRFISPGIKMQDRMLQGRSHFEIDLRRNVSLTGKVKVSKPGTCRRIVSGGSFFLTKSHAEELSVESKRWLHLMLSTDRWDNDQVFLSNVLGPLKRDVVWVQQRKGQGPGAVARFFLGQEESITKIPNSRPWSRSYF